MSVNVFGHSLSSKENTRGPPGIGYKLTSEGQFDVENKRLCNLAAPKQLKDAVNLETLKQIMHNEERHLIEITLKLRSDVDNLLVMMEANQDEIDQQLKSIKVQLDRIQESEQWRTNDA